MKTALAASAAALAFVAASTFAQSSSTTTVNGTGINFNAMTQKDVGGETVTLTIGSGGTSLTKAPSTSPPGVTSGTFSAGLPREGQRWSPQEFRL